MESLFGQVTGLFFAVGALLVVVGVLLFVLGFRIGRKARSVRAGFARAAGVVVDIGHGRLGDRPVFAPTVRFATREGRSVVWKQPKPEPSGYIGVGTQVTVLYDLDHPEDARIERRTSEWLAWVLFAGALTSLIMGGHVLTIWAGARQVERGLAPLFRIPLERPAGEAPASDSPPDEALAGDPADPEAAGPPRGSPAPASTPFRAADPGAPRDPLQGAVDPSSDGEAWVVGDKGTLLRCGATRCMPEVIGSVDLAAVDGTGRGDVWAVGANGTILHHDGARWSPSDSGTTASLTSVWANAPTDAWAVGAEGTVLRFDGFGWSKVPSSIHPTATARRVHGTSAKDVWVVSPAGTITHHFDGVTWKERGSTPGRTSEALWAVSPREVWLGIGASLRHWDGAAWQSSTGGFAAVAFAGREDDVWACGSGSIHRRSGSQWIPMGLPELILGPDVLLAISVGRGEEAFAVGSNGTVLRHGMGAWGRVPSGTTASLTGVWAVAPRLP